MSQAPLGVFDSGLGGLTVVRALLEALPDERIVYLGDTARVPYGTRSADTVTKYAIGCARVLTRRGVKALVVACNTVSAVAIDMLRAELDMPVIGVVEPGAAAAVTAAEAESRARDSAVKVGVLGTTGTVASGAYERAVAQISTRIEVVTQAAPLFVPLAEEGWIEGQVPELAAERYLTPLLERGAGVIVLGCTHYPLLAPVIERAAARIAGRAIPIVDSAHATATLTAAWIGEGRIKKSDARANPDDRLELLVTDRPASFAQVAARFLGAEASHVSQIDLS